MEKGFHLWEALIEIPLFFAKQSCSQASLLWLVPQGYEFDMSPGNEIEKLLVSHNLFFPAFLYFFSSRFREHICKVFPQV